MPLKLKSPAEMDRIREAQALLTQKENAARVPEKNVATPLAYFEISRYTQGSFKGLFVVSQLVTTDKKGKTLKEPIKKSVADGVDIHIAMSALDTAIRRRVFK